ncbi:spore germination protein [Paenibacillus sp. S3N08]|uniref:Spore germination protein n=2 Tax=Paenibacillus agricola TaxID=2716264 RepID=A0ABX0J4U1_9BACL|nr:spore germination protein [Paenibacillus agricola]
MISPILANNLLQMKQIFSDCNDIEIMECSYGPELCYSAFSIHYKSLAPELKINFLKQSLQDLVTYEVGPATAVTVEQVIQFFSNYGVSAQNAMLLMDFQTALEHIKDGNLVIFFDSWEHVLSYKTGTVEKRPVSEPTNEAVVQGPRESTVESLNKNIGLLRCRLTTPKFKLKSIRAGGETQTEVIYGYLEGTVNPETLANFENRLAVIPDYEVLETSYVEEMLEDSPYSPFPQFRYTERPDTAVAAMLDGKIILLVQGTGSILICPGLFAEFLQSSEDYYQRTVISTMVRFLRLAAFFMSLILPSTYIALSNFHPELIPTVLLLAIVDAREGIPFPTLFEALIMEFFFELLREAGIRLPRPIGSAVSIVGALVIGEASINAGIASPIMVVIVAATGIASFGLPQYTISTALRILRFPLMFLSSMLGGFGLMLGLLCILLHLTCLRSLGQPYLAPLAPWRFSQFKDVFVRAPLKTLLRSPRNRHTHKQLLK